MRLKDIEWDIDALNYVVLFGLKPLYLMAEALYGELESNNEDAGLLCNEIESKIEDIIETIERLGGECWAKKAKDKPQPEA